MTYDSAVKFPVAPYANVGSYFDAYAEEMARVAKTIKAAALDRAAAILMEAYADGAHVLLRQRRLDLDCQPYAVRPRERPPQPGRPGPGLAPQVLSLSTNVELLTAIANNRGSERTFVYQFAAPGPARRGTDRGVLFRPLAEHRAPPHLNYGVVEGLHQSVMHALVQYIRQSRMTADSIAASPEAIAAAGHQMMNFRYRIAHFHTRIRSYQSRT